MELSSCYSKRYVKINSIMTWHNTLHLQFHHNPTDCVYASDHNEKIHKNNILTFLLIVITRKNHLNAAGVLSLVWHSHSL